MNLFEQNSSSSNIYKNNCNNTNKLQTSLSISSNGLINDEKNFKVNQEEKSPSHKSKNLTGEKEFSVPQTAHENYVKQNLFDFDVNVNNELVKTLKQELFIAEKTNVRSNNCDRESPEAKNNNNKNEISTKNDRQSLKQTKMTTDVSQLSRSSIKLIKEPSLKLKKKKAKINNRKSNASSSPMSISTFIRSFFSCGASCYSCNGLRRRGDKKNNSIKSHSSNETGLGGIFVAPSTTKAPQNSFKKLDQVIQYSSTESIINKFDNLKTKEKKKSSIPASVIEANHTNTSNFNDKSSNNSKAQENNKITNETLNQFSTSSSVKKKPKIKKQSSIIDENYNLNNESDNFSSANTNNMISSKLVLPILKINDTEIRDVENASFVVDNKVPTQEETHKSMWYFTENEENKENNCLEYSFEEDEEPEEELDEEIDEDEEELDEENEDEFLPEEEFDEDLDQNGKILKQLNLKNKRGDTEIYEDYEETFVEYNDEYEYEECNDEDEDDSHHQNIQSNQRKSNDQTHNSKIKISSSASPIVNSTFHHQSPDIVRSKKDKVKYEQIHSNIPSISFDENNTINYDQSLDENDESLAFSPTSLNDDHDDLHNTNRSGAPSVNFYSKFLTANNLMTERGGLVNIRTGSFNLGCQQDQLSDQLTDSYEFFNSMQNSADHSTFTRSSSNYSFKNSLNFNDSNYNGAANLIIPLQLIKNRKKSTNNLSITNDYADISLNNVSLNTPEMNASKNFEMTINNNVLDDLPPSLANQNASLYSSNSIANTSITLQSGIVSGNTNNLLNVSSGDQDQIRRCSHDPNIEKLHKTFFNNVKLGVSHANSSHISSSSSLSQPPDSQNLFRTSKPNKKSVLNGAKKLSIKLKNKTAVVAVKTETSSSENPSSSITMATKADQSIDDTDSNDIKLELESTEQSDVLNEISKVNKWLRDNKNHHKKNIKDADNNKDNRIKKITKLPSITISEDEDNFNDANKLALNTYVDKKGSNEEANAKEVKTKSSFETNDSAIDIRSYGSISTLSKASSSKSRVNWQSFSKYYRMQLFQTMDTTWSKYQISAMSLEQLMALRKLALIQFSKLVERQHSSMIKSFRLFSKKTSEFQKAYDSIDSLDTPKSCKSKPSATHNKDNDNFYKKCTTNTASAINDNNPNESVVIGNKKISHQLGAQIGTHPSSGIITRKRRKASLKKLEKHLFSYSIESKNSPNLNFESISSLNELQPENKESLTSQNTLSDKQNKPLPNPPTKTNTSIVFGVPLNIIMQRTGQPLPQHILEAMRFIRKLAPNEIGIFRKNGNKARINKLKESMNKNEIIQFHSDDITPFDIADTIKLYFRELPECLITNKLSDILLTNYLKIRPEERKIILQQLMLLIPDENRLVLQTLILFLNEIAKHHKTNQMTRTNLAVCFSPVIFSLNYDNKKKIKPYKLLNDTKNSPSLLTVPPNPLILQVSPASGKVASANKPNSTHVIFDPMDPMHDNSGVYYGPLSQVSPSSMVNSNTTHEMSSASNLNISFNSLIEKTSMVSINDQSDASNLTNSFHKPQNQNLTNTSSEKTDNADKELGHSGANTSFFSESLDKNLSNLEYMSKVVQLCVADMIKYSMDLFTVPFENFDKLKLSVSFGSEPYGLDYFYDVSGRKLKKVDFFTNNVNVQNAFWFYMDKFEDVSIYYLKNEQQNELLDTFSLNNQSSSLLTPVIQNTIINQNDSSLFVSQKNENFNDKLRLWKCCTLVKNQNLSVEKIVKRIKNERHMWDDDFKEGKIVETLDEHTDLYRYVITFMPPHASRDFFEIRNVYIQSKQDNVILTSTSVQQQTGNKLIGDIRANTIISKYIIEKLIATDTTTTFKITHYIKLDYKGYTLEFYNKTFGYMMARLLFNLKLSLLELN